MQYHPIMQKVLLSKEWRLTLAHLPAFEIFRSKLFHASYVRMESGDDDLLHNVCKKLVVIKFRTVSDGFAY
jgi:hypothetical protein